MSRGCERGWADAAGALTRTLRLYRSLAALPWLAACATSGVPEAIRDADRPSPTVASVQRQPEAFLGQQVRWGGSILAVHNGPQSTLIEVLGRPLDSQGEPDADGDGLGRFLVEVAGFKDPAEYPEGRRLSVAGPLLRVETRDVGEFPYPYPVVAATALHLWPEPPVWTRPPPPFAYPWYRPWWGPWYDPWYWY